MRDIKFDLKQVRKSKGITQVELEEKTGISQQMISRYESGDHIPQIDTAVKIADALGVTLDELVVIREAKEQVATKLKTLSEEEKSS